MCLNMCCFQFHESFDHLILLNIMAGYIITGEIIYRGNHLLEYIQWNFWISWALLSSKRHQIELDITKFIIQIDYYRIACLHFPQANTIELQFLILGGIQTSAGVHVADAKQCCNQPAHIFSTEQGV